MHIILGSCFALKKTRLLYKETASTYVHICTFVQSASLADTECNTQRVNLAFDTFNLDKIGRVKKLISHSQLKNI